MNGTAAPLVSVILPTYNMGKYVGGAIESIQRQTIADLELHVIDDGSKDDTREAVAPYLKDPRIHYHYKPNGGLSSARNAGLALCRGRYIGLIDADDLWLPKKLELQLPLFERHPGCGIVYGVLRRMDGAGNTYDENRPPMHDGHITQELFQFNFIPVGTAVFTREAAAIAGGFDERLRMAEDWDFWLRLSVTQTFYHVDEAVYLYRVWEGQMSRNWRGRYDAAFDIMRRFMAANPGLIRPEVLRKALYSSYQHRAYDRLAAENDYAGALADTGRALRAGLSPALAMKLVGRCALHALGVRKA